MTKSLKEKIPYYRGVAMDYSKKKCHNDNFLPSIYRCKGMTLEEEKNHYEKCYKFLQEIEEIDVNWKSPLFSEKQPLKVIVKVLGIIQHYGLKSRLLDVTSDIQVAKYFACIDNFEKNGYVYKFKLNHYSEGPKRLKTKICEIGPCKGDASNQIGKDENLIFEYKAFLKTKSNNIRYDRQKGAFIFFAQKSLISNKSPFNEGDFNIVEEIEGSKKIDMLYDLSINHGINHLFLFPDDSVSFDLFSDYELFVNNQIDACKLVEKYYEKCSRELINALTHVYDTKDKNLFCFLLYELKRFGNGKATDKVNGALKRFGLCEI